MDSFGRWRLAPAAGLLSLAVLASLPATSRAAQGRADNKGQGDFWSLLTPDAGALDALTMGRRAGLDLKGREEQWAMIVRPAPGSLTPIYSPYGVPYGPRRSYFGDGMASAGF